MNLRFLFLSLILVGCGSAPVSPLPPEAKVIWVNSEPGAPARQALEKRINFLKEIYRQQLLFDDRTYRWTDNCLKSVTFEPVSMEKKSLTHVSRYYTKNGAPGFCPGEWQAQATLVAHVYCENDAHFLVIKCPDSACDHYNWKQLCH